MKKHTLVSLLCTSLPLDYPKEVKVGDKIEVVGYLSIWNAFPVVVTNAVLPVGTIAALKALTLP